MYPGTLSCDTPSQLQQAVELGGFNNLNPFVNTLVVAGCIQVGMVLGTVNTGIALYTLVQFTIYSFVAAYVVYVLYSKGFHIFIEIFVTCYFIWPINLIYATGMWKDTFFAEFFLMTLVYSYAHINKDFKILNFAILAALSFISSLARNSGWSSLGVGAILLVAYSIKESRYNILKIGQAQLAGVIIACIFIGIIYPLMGISNTFGTIGKSVPLQQIARTVVDDELSKEEMEEISYFGRSDRIMEEIQEKYVPNLVDSVRGVFDANIISENPYRFNLLWIRLGIHHPIAYFHALVDHTICYWWPDETGWLFDNRIFENNYGVERSAKLLPEKDLGATLYSILVNIPKLELLSNSGFTFWMILLCIYFCFMHHNKIGALLSSPILMIYIGLIPVSYGALFRYTYAAVLSMPMLLGYMFMGPSSVLDERANRKTNWTKYYQQKKSFFSTYTQRFTLKKIFDCMNQSIDDRCDDIKVMELGGGNSCFAKEICNQRNISNYDIVDNNELAVGFFVKQNLYVGKYTGILQDLTQKIDNITPVYDFVFSIGLIEHFQPKDRKQVIQNHFRYCKPGGVVMISFPTPTRKYLFWRRIMELLGVWMFWDETPLTYEDIREELEENGKIIKVELNKRLYLTQMIVLISKQEEK